MQPLEKCKENIEEDGIFQNEDDMRKSLSKFCYGDLYIIGRIWIRALQAILVGVKLSFIPVVHAKNPEPPKKPPKMKYQDLPVYTSPHYDYKDYQEKSEKCPEYNEKLLRKALLPYVKTYRRTAQEMYCSACCTMRSTCDDVCCSIQSSKNTIKQYMRDPDNLMIRQGVVASGTAAGFLLSGGGIPRRIFCTALGALSTGALCFPKETDEIFREVCYHAAKIAIVLYNTTCKKDVALRERVPCKDDMPPPPLQRKMQNKCPK